MNSAIRNNVYVREGCRVIGTRVNPGLKIPPGVIYVNEFLKKLRGRC